MIESIEALRSLYPAAKGRSVQKQLDRLDAHCLRFIALSPFVVIASGRDGANFDASPRGGAPGFVRAPDARTLLIPDAPGNNRLDSLENIIASGRVGLLFLVPGVDETLRVNGAAQLVDEAEIVAGLADARRTPKLAIRVGVEEAYLHCAKALMRSKLWADESRNARSVLPTMGRMLNDQIGTPGPAESQEEMVARYASDL